MARTMPRATLAPGVHHATAVAFDGRGVLILGASGAGKSALALQLIGLGAELIADDQVLLASDGRGRCLARAPLGLPLWVEARGIGLLAAPLRAEASICLAVDLDSSSTTRLPEPEEMLLAGARVPAISGTVTAHFPAAVRLLCLYGRKG